MPNCPPPPAWSFPCSLLIPLFCLFSLPSRLFVARLSALLLLAAPPQHGSPSRSFFRRPTPSRPRGLLVQRPLDLGAPNNQTPYSWTTRQTKTTDMENPNRLRKPWTVDFLRNPQDTTVARLAPENVGDRDLANTKPPRRAKQTHSAHAMACPWAHSARPE